METPRTHLGELTDIAAIEQLLAVDDLTVVDVGCGPGRITREIHALGASITGIEPDAIQAEKNRLLPPATGLKFIEARAEALPLPPHSVDGVFFFRSLHHVPIAAMGAALEEATRILKTDTGFLCVVEPAMTGSHFNLMRPFNDETRVRNAAQQALRDAMRLFHRTEFFEYVQFPSYPDFQAFVARVTGHTFNDVRHEDVETDEVRHLFEMGRLASGTYVFEQPMLLNLYYRPE